VPPSPPSPPDELVLPLLVVLLVEDDVPFEASGEYSRSRVPMMALHARSDAETIAAPKTNRCFAGKVGLSLEHTPGRRAAMAC